MDPLNRISVFISGFSYDDGTTALGEINLEIKQGEFTGVLGANGSGKTTLLKLMDGLLKSYKGNVLLDGVEITKLKPQQIYRKTGLIFQNPDEQLFAANVFEDVAFGPRNMGMKEDKVAASVTQALDLVGMNGLAKRPIHYLSYGQKKRVCIAGLLAMGHEILLMDEPTAGLDPLGEEQMMELLKKLNKENGVTIAMTTHNVDLAAAYFKKIYILERGTVFAAGKPQEVFQEIFKQPHKMKSLGLKFPSLMELFWELKNKDKIPVDKMPLNIAQARKEIKNIVK